MDELTALILKNIKTLKGLANTDLYDEEIKLYIQAQYYSLTISGVAKPQIGVAADDYIANYSLLVGFYYTLSFDEGVMTSDMQMRRDELTELLRTGGL